MTYGVEFTRTAERDLSRLDKTVAQQVLDKLRWLADSAETVSHKALTAQLRGAFSLRIGAYRAIYGCYRTRRRIIVHMVRHRGEVYRIS